MLGGTSQVTCSPCELSSILCCTWAHIIIYGCWHDIAACAYCIYLLYTICTLLQLFHKQIKSVKEKSMHMHTSNWQQVGLHLERQESVKLRSYIIDHFLASS